MRKNVTKEKKTENLSETENQEEYHVETESHLRKHLFFLSHFNLQTRRRIFFCSS